MVESTVQEIVVLPAEAGALSEICAVAEAPGAMVAEKRELNRAILVVEL